MFKKVKAVNVIVDHEHKEGSYVFLDPLFTGRILQRRFICAKEQLKYVSYRESRL